MSAKSLHVSLALAAAGWLSACGATGFTHEELQALSTARPARSAAKPESASVRTLARAVELALERNPSLAEATARVRAAEAGLRQARAALWPMAGADLALTWAEAPSVYLFKSIDARSLAQNTDFNDPGSLENTELGLGANWNLWRGGRDQATIDAAKFGVAAGVAAEDAQRNALIGMVVAVWLDHRGARELATSDEARVRMLERQLGDARARVASGAALDVDALAIEVRLAQAREARTRSQLAAKLALAALRELLALEAEDELDPAPEAPAPVSVAESLEAALALAHERRHELRAARAGLDAAQMRVRAAQATWKPRLDLQGRVWGDDNEVGLDFEEANSALTLSLSFDVLDGGLRSAGRDAARAESMAAHARWRAAELAVQHDVDRAWLALEGARARLEVAEQAVRAAEQGSELVAKLLESGAATTSRYLDAESDLARARAEHVLARIDVQRAGFELLRATGSLENVSW